MYFLALYGLTALGLFPGLFIVVSLVVLVGHSSAGSTSDENSDAIFLLSDHKLKAELVAEGLDYPTAMAFLGHDDVLVLEKDKGMVRRVIDGNMQSEPLLDLNLSGAGESGLVGIAIANNEQYHHSINNSVWIFLYVSEPVNNDSEMRPVGFPPGNRLYRYELANERLINPKLLLDLPVGDRIHNGGKVTIGPDKNVYVTVGDIGRFEPNKFPKTLNNDGGQEPDGTGGILRITQDGRPVMEKANGILGPEYPLNLYYAYGIRNSFGIDFDPLMGRLWDTENGAESKDEINLVEPGFNSGWKEVQGVSYLEKGFNRDDLVEFNGNGRYSDPEFVWHGSGAVGPTALKFLTSDKLGKEYQNDMFVGDFNNGYIYHFELNENRTELSFNDSLNNTQLDILKGSTRGEGEVFARGPGGVIDIQVGPDGYMYVLTLLLKGTQCNPEEVGCVTNDDSKIKGAIFRIMPAAYKSLP